MARGTIKPLSLISTRQIMHTRLYDDSSLDTKYEVLGKLGEGSFGTVFRVRSKDTDVFYAMKTIAKKVRTNIASVAARRTPVVCRS
jgi:serine/threonine protein kinase